MSPSFTGPDVTYSTAVLALTMSDSDESLVRYAATVARALSIRTIHLFWLEHRHDLPDELVAKLTRTPSAGDGATQLEKNVREFGTWPEDTQFVSHGAIQSALELLKAVRDVDADLLCLGSVAPDGPLTSKEQRVTKASPCTVLALPMPHNAAIETILVPVDFSEHAALALDAGLQVAAGVGKTEVIAQHVYDVPSRFDAAGCSFEEFAASLKENAAEKWQEMVDRKPGREKARIRYDLIPHDDRSHEVSHIVEGVAHEISADLLVCGSQGRTAMAQFFFGGMIESLLARTTTPVLCVKRKGETHGLLDTLLHS